MVREERQEFKDLPGLHINTINRGLKELSAGAAQKPSERIRKEDGGRKKAITPAIWFNIENFIEPHKRGEPESTLQWISKRHNLLSKSKERIDDYFSTKITSMILMINLAIKKGIRFDYLLIDT